MADTLRELFTLSEPITDLDGSELNQIGLRKPKAKDLRVLDKVEGEIAGMYEILSRLSGVPVSSIDELEATDLTAMIDWLTPFLPGGGVVGKTR